ncbi:PTB domain-containing engulfment adapter protein 1-like [Centruroides sculpturatus]|uniref:PTB domain-containing engulfment adapter protein 1-like n=1 Tax=Centruroides sculpturatus TaxID=218467 RepID=UPI000C6DB81A|nr:PTB domain-containing engulfment adapter protein 1-like [Centruroides sculpturatus]
MLSRQSLMKWTQNNKNNSKSTNKNWVHPPEALQQGHVAYLVKFFGYTEVGKAKGIDVVKEGITKLKFDQQIKRSEGVKLPKVELTISVDGVGVQDAKTKTIHHQYPLHRISYCADDKADKKFFSFIAKEADTERHSCFVFSSDKLVFFGYTEVGKAKGIDVVKEGITKLKVQELELENSQLKKRLAELEKGKDKKDVECHKSNNNILEINSFNNKKPNSTHNASVLGTTPILQPPPPVPPRLHQGSISTSKSSLLPSQDLLALSSLYQTSPADDFDFNPRNGQTVSQNTQNNRHINNGQMFFTENNINNSSTLNDKQDSQKDLFGATPFIPTDQSNKQDPFGMGEFSTLDLNGMDLDNAIGAIDKKLSEMKDGFSQGLSFGVDDFDFATLDSKGN